MVDPHRNRILPHVTADQRALLRTFILSPGQVIIDGGVPRFGDGITPGGVWQSRIARTYIDDLGLTYGRTESSVIALDNAARIQGALDSVKTVYARGGNDISSGPINLRNGCRLIYEGDDKSRPNFYLPASVFGNTSQTISGATAGATFLRAIGGADDASALSDVLLEGFGIVSASAQGRYLAAIYGRNLVNFRALGLEISGIPAGLGVSLGSCKGGAVDECYMHDFYDDTTGWTGTAKVQSTGIVLDDGRPNGPSQNLSLSRNRIISLRQGPNLSGSALQAGTGSLLGTALGQQTDGINDKYFGSSGHTIRDNVIRTVSEGIDFFGCNSIISGNVLDDCLIHCMKMVHGAADNTLSDNQLSNYGRVGQTYGTSNNPADGNAVRRNIDKGGSIRAGPNAALWRLIAGSDDNGVAYRDNAAIRFEGAPDPSVKWSATLNVVQGKSVVLTPDVRFGVRGDQNADQDLGNRALDIAFDGAPASDGYRIYAPLSTGGRRNALARLAGESVYRDVYA